MKPETTRWMADEIDAEEASAAFDIRDQRAMRIYELAILMTGLLPSDVAEFLRHCEYGLALHALADEVMKP